MTMQSADALLGAAIAYEKYFVPALFEEWAPRVADAARLRPGLRALDVACGTGVLAREAALRVGFSGGVVGLDTNAGMLAVAQGIAHDIEWRQGAAEDLPFPDSSFDSVVSQFGLMLFADRARAVREMLRVLAPGGRMAIAVWDRLENSPAYAAETSLLERIAGSRAAAAARVPFSLGDREELRALFNDAGAESVALTTLPGTGRFPSIRSMVEADLRGWLPVMGVALSEALIARVLAEAEKALRGFVTGDGTVEFDAPAHIVTGTKR